MSCQGGKMFNEIQKRDGKRVRFDAEKITNAIVKAGAATGEFNGEVAMRLTLRVLNLAAQIIGNRVPAVEEIQDIVEEVLLSSVYRSLFTAEPPRRIYSTGSSMPG